MEPMNVGSAPSSPVISTVQPPQFLPGFLMGGEAQSTVSLPSGRVRNNSSFSKVQTPKKTISSNVSQMNSSTTLPFVHLTEKGGPPKTALFDNLENKHFSTILNTSTTEDLVYQDSNSTFDTNWVTVFGFPPSAMGLVLAKMASCGTLVEKILPTRGNWMHLRFSGANEVSRALAMNGKCIGDCLMIGVHLYKKGVPDNREFEGFPSPTADFCTPTKSRSLRQTLSPSPQNTLNDDDNIVVVNRNLPQKASGVVNKAMEYMFGW